MRYWLYILIFFSSLQASGQNRDERSVLAGARLVHKTVFETRDSLTLVKLFSPGLTYGHSSGKVESKAEAIRGIVQNRSVYEALTLGPTYISLNGNTAVTRYDMSARERKPDGSVSTLNLHIVLVWTKENKDWKLVARQAVKI